VPGSALIEARSDGDPQTPDVGARRREHSVDTRPDGVLIGVGQPEAVRGPCEPTQVPGERKGATVGH
jgi:hypothetical protein